MRFFTAAEVDELIPRLELLIERLQRADRALRDEVGRILAEQPTLNGESDAARLLEMHPELRPLAEELQRCMQEIHACGGQLKDTALGLVDFPGEIGGRMVLLCWQYGEKRLAYYHAMDGGFRGRKPLDLSSDTEGYLQ